MKASNMVIPFMLSLILGFLLWGGYSRIIDAYPELESLLSVCFALFLGSVIGVLTCGNEPGEAYVVAMITLPLIMLITRILAAGLPLDLANFLLNYVIYLPLTSIGFFASWVFAQHIRKH
jgi:hypothetical protein